MDARVQSLRRALGLADHPALDLLDIIEFRLKYIYAGFKLKIVPDSELPNAEAEADCEKKTITVRQSVYDDLCCGSSRARMTIAHEIGHLALHQGILQRSTLLLDSPEEAQARQFAACLLMPTHLIERYRSVKKVVGIFQVSEEAAKRRIREIARRKSAKRREWRGWLREVLPKYEKLIKLVEPIIIEALRDADILTFPLEKRVKSEASALKKITDSRYESPASELIDLCGVRVVVITSDEVEQVAKLIRSLFVIHQVKDKSSELSVHMMGYRSLHFVCSLGNERGALPEYSQLGDLKFEIQIRTSFQHSWAEIAHNRIYKPRTALSDEEHRDINKLSVEIENLQDRVDKLIARLPK